MNHNYKFLNLVSENKRICPLCGNYHSVEKKTVELEKSHFSTRFQFIMECEKEKKKFLFESLFDKPINEMHFERKDIVN